MSLTLKDIGIGQRSGSGAVEGPPVGCWDEGDRRARYDALSDAC